MKRILLVSLLLALPASAQQPQRGPYGPNPYPSAQSQIDPSRSARQPFLGRPFSQHHDPGTYGRKPDFWAIGCCYLPVVW